MKSLALYIDKWYIVGAVNTDGITRLVNLPNREDRIWLYFYEDVANDEISYGKGFQSKFRNNEPHYYGDVFGENGAFPPTRDGCIHSLSMRERG